MTTLTSLAKKAGVPSKVAIVIVVVAFGFLYQAFQTFLDPALQEQTIAFVTGSFGTAVLVYEFATKYLWEK